MVTKIDFLSLTSHHGHNIQFVNNRLNCNHHHHCYSHIHTLPGSLTSNSTISSSTRPPGAKAAKREKREVDDDFKGVVGGIGTTMTNAMDERDLYDMVCRRYNHYVSMGNIEKANEMEEELDYLIRLRRERVAEQQAKKKAATSRQEPPPSDPPAPAPPAVTPANRRGSTDEEKKDEEPTQQEEDDGDDDEELVMFDNEEDDDGQHQAQAQY